MKLKKLDLKEGDKVLFAEKDGNIVLLNASLVAFKEIKKNMANKSKNQNLDQEDINEYVKEVRLEEVSPGKRGRTGRGWI